MTIVSGDFTSFAAIGNREDLRDVIYDITPTETVFMASIGKGTAKATRHEWQTDALATAANNNQLEGDTYTFSTPSATTRLTNSTTISSKTLSVSETQDAVNKAGRAREYAYQLVKRTKELKLDMETTLTGNQTPVPADNGASTTVARQLRPLCGWYSTNDDRGTSGADGSSTAAATDGTQRELDEIMFKRVIRLCINAGGMPETVMVGTYNKQLMSTFTGNVTKTQNVAQDGGGRSPVTLVTNIDFYRSDWGVHKIVFNRRQRSRDVHVIDTEFWELAYLRSMKVVDLAKTADSTEGAVRAEYTLVSKNQAASGIIADTNINNL